MSTEKQVPKLKPALKTTGGLLIPKYMFSDDKCLSGLAYNPTPDDIFIVTYPKSGTTWAQYIVWEILNNGVSPPPMNDILNIHVPFLEVTGAEAVRRLPPPRPIKTHIPFDLHPYHHLSKYIYIARNPKDTCVSYFNHTKEMPFMYKFSEGTLDDFFECFLSGEVAYGDWFDHVMSWYVHKDDPNVLFLTYEEMKKDSVGAVLTIAKFLGEEYHQRLKSDPELLHRIVKYTSFETMKKLNFYMPRDGTKVDPDGGFPIPQTEEEAKCFYVVNFFWKGKVGNWKNYLSEVQVKRLNDMVLSRPRGKEIADLWEN